MDEPVRGIFLGATESTWNDNDWWSGASFVPAWSEFALSLNREFNPLERCPTRLIVDVSESHKVARDDETPIFMTTDTSMTPKFSPRTMICMPPVNNAESIAIQGVADFSKLLTNAKGSEALVSERNNSTLATMPLSEPLPTGFRHMTDTSDIHVELEHDVAANRTDTVADRYEKYWPTISIKATPVAARSATLAKWIWGSGYEDRKSVV